MTIGSEIRDARPDSPRRHPRVELVLRHERVANTLGNVTSKSRFERTVLAATTAVLAVLCGYVALIA
jgi:hypothetical protein